MLIQEPIQATIQTCLNNYSYNDALFLAERLHYETNSDESIYTLASIYFRNNNEKQCYHLLKERGSTIKLSPKCKFLLAKCCEVLGRLSECEETLLLQIDEEVNVEALKEYYKEQTPFVLKILSTICFKTDRKEQCIKYLKESLKLNPFLWESFEFLCNLKVDLDGEACFQIPPQENNIYTYGHGEIDYKSTVKDDRKKARNLFTSTPMMNSVATFGGLLPLDSSSESNVTFSPINESTPLQQQGNVRRSSRLFSNSNNISVKENSKTPIQRLRPSAANPLTPVKSPIKKNNKKKMLNEIENLKNSADDLNSPIIPTQPQQQTQLQSIENLLQLYRSIGLSYKNLQNFQCLKSLEILQGLKEEQLKSPFVIALIAKNFFELGDYEEAEKHFKNLHTNHPYKIEHLEYYSTTLWHLQSEIELSKLSHDLLTNNKNHYITYLTIGNCFSLQKEYETSIKFFKRSIQLNPHNAYSYTLLGHEYVSIEEYEKAIKCFRNASRINPSLYYSWYGIAMIFYKQERFDRAEVYYKKALEICPSNSVLLCHLGVVQQNLNKPEKSLETFNLALEKNPKDPLCKFHRASLLFSLNKHDEALDELEQLKRIVPKESLVYFLIAKIYSKKGDTHKALLHFSWATDLDPKGINNQIKESIEPVLGNNLSLEDDMDETLADN